MLTAAALSARKKPISLGQTVGNCWGQHTSRIGFSIATAIKTNKVVCFLLFFVWTLFRLLCCVCWDTNVAVAVPLGWKTLQTKVVEKIKTHILHSTIPPLPWKSYRLCHNVEFVSSGRATDGSMAQAHCILDYWDYSHTLRICNASPWQQQ